MRSKPELGSSIREDVNKDNLIAPSRAFVTTLTYTNMEMKLVIAIFLTSPLV